MATTLRQFNHALNSLVRGLTAATQATTAPIARLSDVLQPLALRRNSNNAFARLAAVADSANVADARNAAHTAAFGSPSDLRGNSGNSRSRYGIEHLSEHFALAIGRLTELVPERTRAARDGGLASPGSGLLKALVRRLAGTFAGLSARAGRPASLSLKHPTAPAGFTLAAASWLSSRLPASRPLARTINATSASAVPWRAGRLEGHAAWSAIAGEFGRLRATIADLAALSAPAHAGSLRAGPAGQEGRFARGPIASQLPRAPRFAQTGYFRTGSIRTPLADARRLTESQLGEYVRRLTDLARKFADFAVRPARAVARSVVVPPDMPRSIALQSRWPRLPTAVADGRETPPRRAPLLNLLDRAAPLPATPATATAAPSTINVAISVHGVANGDEFIRRHGYEIARVLDQVLEQRARRAF